MVYLFCLQRLLLILPKIIKSFQITTDKQQRQSCELTHVPGSPRSPGRDMPGSPWGPGSPLRPGRPGLPGGPTGPRDPGRPTNTQPLGWKTFSHWIRTASNQPHELQLI